ncbi:MAG: hypothetical protein FWF06_01460 [Symbiobacteriaceae bacterium]|nr:hypothetical protein [Symbiobacteriaceae bacterium]
MPQTVVRFLYPRGPRLAASPAETTALRHIQALFNAHNIATSEEEFASCSGMEWFYAVAYLFFPLGTVFFVVNIPLGLALVTLGLILLRADFFLWPGINKIFALNARGRAVVAKIPSLEEIRFRVVVTANADSRRVFPLFAKLPWLDRLGPYFMGVVDIARLIHWLLYIAAAILNIFGLRYQISLLWRASTVSGVLSLCTCGIYLLHRMHGRPLNCANDNLTGLQVLVDAAAHMAAAPCQHTELLFAAVGSGRVGMLGTVHLIRKLKLDPDATYFINLTSLGSGVVSMVSKEGWSRPINASDELTGIGYLIGSNLPTPLEINSTRQRRSDATAARHYGFQAMTIAALQKNGWPEIRLKEEDIVWANLDYTTYCLGLIIKTLDENHWKTVLA